MPGFEAIQSDALANAAFRGQTFIGPASLFLAVHIGDPGNNGTFNPAATVLRKAVAFDAPLPAERGICRLSADLVWAPSAVLGSQTITDFSLWTALTGAGYFAAGHLVNTLTTVSGSQFVIPKGTLAGAMASMGN